MKKLTGIVALSLILGFLVLIFLCNIMPTATINAATTGVTVEANKTLPVQLVDENGLKYGNKTVDNKQRVVTTQYYTEIALGNISNHFPIVLSGRTLATKLNTLVDLSAIAADQVTVPVAMPSVPVVAVAMEVVSSDADDYASGTGARSVHIAGLDLNGDIISEALDLDAADGTTPVATVNSYSRVNCFGVVTAGSSGAAEGLISVRAVADTPIYSSIPVGFNESQQAFFTVPAGNVFVITGWSGGATGKESFLYLQASVNACDGYELNPGVFQTIDLMSLSNAHTQVDMIMPIVIPALADIKITSESTNAAGGTASGTIRGFYEPAP